MDPVPRTALNMALESLFNRVLALDPVSRPRLAPWRDHCLSLQLQPPGVQIQLLFTEQGVRIVRDTGRDADATIVATPLAMLRFLAPQPFPGASSHEVQTQGVQTQGNQALVDAFRGLLRELEPDWEAELARHLGDIVAHEAGRRVRQGLNWGRRAGDSLLQNVEEYLEEEARLVPSRPELNACRGDTAPLEQQLDDLAARIERLEQRLRDSDSRP